MAVKPLSAEDAAALAQHFKQQRTSKYRNVKTTVDGIVFDSKKEARRYRELTLLAKAGELFRLQLQPRYRLCAFQPEWRDDNPPALLGYYVADFRYCVTPLCCCAWGCVIEDVKGVKTALYNWKKRHVEAQYNVKILET